jgi:phosphatidylinositol-3-phosphatase
MRCYLPRSHHLWRQPGAADGRPRCELEGILPVAPVGRRYGNCYPSTSNCLYASKHDPFINFETVQDHDLNKRVPIEQLRDDLAKGHVPNVSVIVANQCNDMHGLGASSCGTTVPSCANSDAQCIQAGDTYTKTLVENIRGSDSWKHGNDAIVITVDEGNTNLGCCDAATKDGLGGGGGNVATVVVTNHDARHPDKDTDGFTDPAPYNHYSLMATIEGAFDLRCAQATCDTAHVKPMTPLFRDP